MNRALSIHLFACAGLGVVFTVATAWAWALWGPETDHRSFHRSEPPAWPGWVPPDWPRVPSGERMHSQQLGHERIRVHGVSPTENYEGSTPPRRIYIMTTHTTGLPAPAMQRSQRSIIDRGALKSLSADVELPSWIPVRYGRGLPLQPVWPGFTIDTAFFGGIAFVAMRGYLAIRRRLRLRCGWCQNCGYDLTGNLRRRKSFCPECGA